MTEKTAASAPHAPSSKRLEPLRQVDAGVLSIAYYEAGPADGPAVMLHAWLPLRHSQLCRCRAATGRARLPRHRSYLRGYGPTRFRSPATPRSGEQAAVGADMMALMDAAWHPPRGVRGLRLGWTRASVGAALWPERCIGLVCVNSYLIQDIANAMKPMRPSARWRCGTSITSSSSAAGWALPPTGARSPGYCGRNGRRTGRSTMPVSSELQWPTTIQTMSMW